MSLLTSRKADIVEQNKIPDEATWRLFCEAFQNGFDKGYWIIENGATAKSSYEKVELFE